VELNAFTSRQFLDWLRSNLTEHGAGKVVPNADTLAVQYRRALIRQEVNRQIDEASEQVSRDADAAAIPDDLANRVRALLADDPSMSWDEAVARVARAEVVVYSCQAHRGCAVRAGPGCAGCGGRG
jgi:hypothetical protein